MELYKMIAELERERDRLNEAIFALERLSAAKAKKRGRPTKGLRPDSSMPVNHSSPDTPDEDSPNSLPNGEDLPQS